MTKDQLKAIKKRGFWFQSRITIPLSNKYQVSIKMIDEIRELAIYKKLSQADICIKIQTALESGAYLTAYIGTDKPKGFLNSNQFLQYKKSLLTFLLHLTPEQFAEITQLTKYDFDYIGADKKVPSRKEYREYLKGKYLEGGDMK